MPEDETDWASRRAMAAAAGRRTIAVSRATLLGLALAMVGLVAGVVMALKRTAAPCPDGTYFPEGTTDLGCYVHAQAGVGVAIAALSVVLGILLVFTSILVRTALAPRS